MAKNQHQATNKDIFLTILLRPQGENTVTGWGIAPG